MHSEYNTVQSNKGIVSVTKSEKHSKKRKHDKDYMIFILIILESHRALIYLASVEDEDFSVNQNVFCHQKKAAWKQGPGPRQVCQ